MYKRIRINVRIQYTVSRQKLAHMARAVCKLTWCGDEIGSHHPLRILSSKKSCDWMRLHVGCSYLQSPSNKRPLGTAYFNGACFRRKLHSARPAHALYCLRASRHDRPMHFLAWVCDSFIYALKCKYFGQIFFYLWTSFESLTSFKSAQVVLFHLRFYLRKASILVTRLAYQPNISINI